MRPFTSRRPRRTAAAFVATLVATTVAASGCGFQGLYSAPLPGGADLGAHPYEVTIDFADVLDLVPQSAVKVNDIAVGKVTDIALDGWDAKVTIEVNGDVRLPANARAQIAQTSLLGEKYVDLEQPLGKPAPGRLHDGSHIPASRTTSAPEAEQVLGALSLLLNEGGLTQIRIIANELNGALSGREPQIRDLLGQLNTFVGTLDAQKTKITQTLTDLDTLAETLNRQKRLLESSLSIYPDALHVLSAERGKLVTLLTSLSHLGTVATGVVDATQHNLVSSLQSLAPVLQKLQQSGSNLPNALRILGTFPFPVGTSRQFVRGDYANLAATLNLNLADTLCGIDSTALDPKHLLCKVGRKLPLSERHKTLEDLRTDTLTPTLIGAGG
jgi:phospholipid/cholesterol/gamma-HCH transport system substrate-binding protein